jgi:hypothetical protein
LLLVWEVLDDPSSIFHSENVYNFDFYAPKKGLVKDQDRLPVVNPFDHFLFGRKNDNDSDVGE